MDELLKQKIREETLRDLKDELIMIKSKKLKLNIEEDDILSRIKLFKNDYLFDLIFFNSSFNVLNVSSLIFCLIFR